jgi:hypothetical protein
VGHHSAFRLAPSVTLLGALGTEPVAFGLRRGDLKAAIPDRDRLTRECSRQTWLARVPRAATLLEAIGNASLLKSIAAGWHGVRPLVKEVWIGRPILWMSLTSRGVAAGARIMSAPRSSAVELARPLVAAWVM